MRPYNYLLGAILIALIVSVGACTYYKNKAKECGNRPTQSDTVYKHTVDSSTAHTPTIVGLEHGQIQNLSTSKPLKPIVIEKEGKRDTVYLKADVEPVLNQCADVVYYSDSIPVQYGQAIIKNRVHGNRLDSQQLILHQSIPQITTTIMQPKRKPKRFGIGIQLGYGVGKDLILQPVVSAGISYNLIRF